MVLWWHLDKLSGGFNGYSLLLLRCVSTTKDTRIILFYYSSVFGTTYQLTSYGWMQTRMCRKAIRRSPSCVLDLRTIRTYAMVTREVLCWFVTSGSDASIKSWESLQWESRVELRTFPVCIQGCISLEIGSSGP